VFRVRILRSLAAVAFIVASTHVAFSAAVGLTLDAAYQHRIFDIRRWPVDFSAPGAPDAVQRFTDAVTEMVSAFLTGHDTTRTGSTIFYGSSFTYGYPWQESVITSYRYGVLSGKPTLNVSVIGARMSMLENGILCGARNAGIRSATAIVELPVINAAAALLNEQTDGVDQTACRRTIGRRRSPVFAARHPLGIGWTSFIWDDKAYAKGDESIVLAPVPDDYFVTAVRFAEIEGRFRSQVMAVARAAQEVADRVYVFPSPVFLPGVTEVGRDADAVRAQLAAALDACRAVPGVVCLDPSAFYSRRDAYYNMTHLNQHGHQAMAEWLTSAVGAEPSTR